MPHMNVAVGERRTVMQVEAGVTLVLFEHLVVNIKLFPVPEHFRLALGQTRAHGKVGFRQIKRCVKILWHMRTLLYVLV